MASQAPEVMTEKQKMLQGLPYLASDPELWRERVAARKKLRQYNDPTNDYEDTKSTAAMLKSLLGSVVDSSPPFMEPPLSCDYGYNISCGRDCYFNFGAVLLDCCPITIGDRVLAGPNLHIYTAGHPLESKVRDGLNGPEFAKPITIGNDVWLGGNVTIVPGVTVGDGAVVAAGAVVVKNVAPFTCVGGNPAKFIKNVT